MRYIYNIYMELQLQQATQAGVIEFEGVGVHSGQKVSLRLHQKETGGIRFSRIDLPGSPQVVAHINNATGVQRRTQLIGDGFTIDTPEHLLAALSAMQMYHVLIEIDGSEVPILDGSAKCYVEKLAAWQPQEMRGAKLVEPIYWTKAEQHLIAIPSETLKLSYTLDYPGRLTQFASFEVTSELFQHQISSCRTFCLYEEVAPLIEKGLIKGGSLDNAVVYKDVEIMAKGGLRFPNESARHKLLDMIGDFALAHPRLQAHIIAARTGHEANIAFAKTLAKYLDRE